MTRRYLDLVKAAVLDELYIENELRIQHLLEQAERGRPPESDRMRDPIRNMRVRATRLLAERRSGLHSPESIVGSRFALTTVGRARLDRIEQCIEQLGEDDLSGSICNCGVGRGGVEIFTRAAIDAFGMDDRTLWLADTFQPAPRGEADLNEVRDAFARFDVLDDRVRFLQGELDTTLPRAPIDQIALLRVASTGNDALTAMRHLYERVVEGGYVLIDDFDSEATQSLIDRFRDEVGSREPIERVDWSAVYWRKAAPSKRTAVPAPAPESTVALSVVVVFYNMRREAARTLHSLSRAYQLGVNDVEYEVIVVENGSAPDQVLGAEYVRSFGEQFRYLDMAENATPSPVGALNAGIAMARGEALALMIDGAHVLTPGVLHFGLVGLETYQPAIVATQQWYVGPGQQPDLILAGYDQAQEDELFAKIAWPSDGYRLFDIGHFVGDRDWLDGLWESNCLFVPRSLLDQVGPFDEAFSMPGGGYANLDLYERLGSTPGVTSVTILGEGSFHQVHGGTTTNQAEVDARHGEIASYSDHFAELRGRPYQGHGQFTHYVGALRPNSLRSRARRRTAAAFFEPRSGTGEDGLPERPVPMPQDLRSDFIAAFWNTLVWKRSSWLGWRTRKTPTDLFVYQELLSTVRPDWIIETGPGPGGRTLFLASVCEMLDHGQVVSVDRPSDRDRPQHPRITYVEGSPHEASTAAIVAELVGEDPHALVVLGGWGSRQRVAAEFERYAPLVPVGSYVIVEDTIVNGHPVWPGFGSGPMEAVKGIVNERASFAPDHDLERYGLTFNPHGFLKRVR